MEEKNKTLKKFAYLMGLSMCNNVIYVFNKETLYINISLFISIILFIYILLKCREKINNTINKIHYSFKLYMFFSFMSIIPCAITFFERSHLITSCLYGLGTLVFLSILYFDIVFLEKQKDNLIKGITHGFIINLLFSILQFVFFHANSYFTLAHLFPNPAFQISGRFNVLYGVTTDLSLLNIYTFRAQGLFLETSYYLTFVVGSILILSNTIKNAFIKFLIIILTVILCLISESGNFSFIIICYTLYFVTCLIKNKGKVKFTRKKLLVVPILLCVITIFCIYAFNNTSLMKSISNTISSTNMIDIGNSSRLKSLKKGIELIDKYPFGIGYNVTSNLMSEEYSYGQNYIFSTLLTNELEIGLIGNIAYVFFGLIMPLTLLFKTKSKINYAISISAIGMFLCQLSNGISFWKMQYILLLCAIVNVSLNEIKFKKGG